MIVTVRPVDSSTRLGEQWGNSGEKGVPTAPGSAVPGARLPGRVRSGAYLPDRLDSDGTLPALVHGSVGVSVCQWDRHLTGPGSDRRDAGPTGQNQPDRVSAILPTDARAGAIALEVNEMGPLSTVQILDGVMQTLLGALPRPFRQRVIEPRRPVQLFRRQEDEFLVG